MGTQITITSSDGFIFGAYEAKPTEPAKGGVVVIQEIFGVNIHIREVCDGYAEAGYHAVAPALFDQIEPNIELGYEAEDMTRGVDLARGKLKPADAQADIQATIDYVAASGNVGVVGYCFGGLMTWLAACQLKGLTCASGYYGGGIIGFNELQPQVPTILHFGELDAHIPMSDVSAIEAAHPEVAVHVYDADHGFNCNHRASFDQAAADLARSRTLEFFSEHL